MVSCCIPDPVKLGGSSGPMFAWGMLALPHRRSALRAPQYARQSFYAFKLKINRLQKNGCRPNSSSPKIVYRAQEDFKVQTWVPEITSTSQLCGRPASKEGLKTQVASLCMHVKGPVCAYWPIKVDAHRCLLTGANGLTALAAYGPGCSAAASTYIVWALSETTACYCNSLVLMVLWSIDCWLWPNTSTYWLSLA